MPCIMKIKLIKATSEICQSKLYFLVTAALVLCIPKYLSTWVLSDNSLKVSVCHDVVFLCQFV